jgi:hypothetical protein
MATDSLYLHRVRVREKLLELYRGQRGRGIAHKTAVNVAVVLARREFLSVSSDTLRKILTDSLRTMGEPSSFGGLRLGN